MLALSAGLGIWSAMWAEDAWQEKVRIEKISEQTAAANDSRETLDWAKGALSGAMALSGKGYEESLERTKRYFGEKAFARWTDGLGSLGIKDALEASGAELDVKVVRLESPGRDPSGSFPFEGCALARAKKDGEVVAQGWLSIRGAAEKSPGGNELSLLMADRGEPECGEPLGQKP